MRVGDLLPLLDASLVAGSADVEVTSVTHDSRAVDPGALFCCVHGAVADGHLFAPAAVDAGAAALLVEHAVALDGAAVAQLQVDDVRVAIGPAAAAVTGEPSRALRVVGVTGTNGKTTVTHLLASILRAAGERTEVLGTLSGPRTTPEAPELQTWLARQRAAGVAAVAMEVSSHALALHRVDGTRFAAAVFTNLSRDHLDFHGTMEAYFRAKARLFTPAFTDLAVVNRDDMHGRLLADAAEVPTVTYGFDDVTDLRLTAAGSTFTWRGHELHLPLAGRFNVANALAAATTAAALDIASSAIATGLASVPQVPGRFERVDEGQDFDVVVDYAHTPDGLEQVLAVARELVGRRRVHVVFGCGGDRDPGKRAPMGEAAARGADRVVLTADNSRSESTDLIIDEIRRGIPSDPTAEVVVEPDRDRAIAVALVGAAAGDLVVLAGKGHETTQTIGDVVTPFDDREVARRHLRRLLQGRAS